MEVYVRKRKSGPPLEVILALIVGIAIGVAVGYGLFNGKSETEAPPPTEQVATNDPNTPIEPPSEVPPETTEPGTTPAPAEPAPTEPAPAEPTPADEVAALEDVWPARHLFIAVSGQKLDTQTKEMLAELKPGGVLLLADNIKVKNQMIDLVSEIKAAVGLGTTIDSLPLIAAAQEGGTSNVIRLKDAPTASKIGAEVLKTGVDDGSRVAALAKVTEAGLSVGKSCLDRGIGVLLAPVLDVYAKGAAKDMQTRTFGDDYKVVSAVGLAYANGVVQAGVLPVVKHFPGIGTLKADAKSLGVLSDGQERLAELAFPFNEAARVNVPGILVGHVVVPALDDAQPPRPASLSPVLVKSLIRDKWGFGGVIIADDISKDVLVKTRKVEAAAVEALAAGCDAVILLDPDLEKIKMVCATIEKAATDGTLNRVELSNSKKRLDAWQQALKTPRAGLDEPLPKLPGAEPAADVTADAATPAPDATAVTATPVPAPAATTDIEYTVERGDGLKKIATKFGVTIQDIKEWNSMSSENLFEGQKLIIKSPQPAGATETPPAPAPAETTEPAPADSTTTEPPSEEPSVQPPANTKAVEHSVKSGEFLSSIATKYGVTHQDLMLWNHLNDHNLKPGKVLTIYVPMDFNVPADAAQPAPAEPAAAAPATEATADAPALAPAPAEGTEVSYTIQRGDNLANIAAKYGVTVNDLKEWNGLDSNRLDVGQALKIRPTKMPAE